MKYNTTRFSLKALSLLLVAFLFFVSQDAFSQVRYYVRSGPSNGDGLSWATASNNLQQTIDNAEEYSEVYVSEGTYQPAAGQPFSIKEGMRIYGGFPATGSPSYQARNYAAYPTVLKGNGTRVIENLDGITAATILDGFTITDGSATDGFGGGGIRNVDSAISVSNCIFKNNTTTVNGGAISNTNSTDGTFTNCLFYNNTAAAGGAVNESASASNYYNCTFAKNNATGNGGAFNTQNANLRFYNCIAAKNTAGGAGQQFRISNGYTGWDNSICLTNAANVSNGYLIGSNSINADPLFTDAANNNFTLQPNSPAIDSGNTDYFYGENEKDLAFNPRVIDGAIDMGVYEAIKCDHYEVYYVNTHAYVTPGNSVTLSATADAVSFTWSPATGLNTTTGNSVIATPAVSTTYTVTAVSSIGCTASQTIRVIVSARPVHYVRVGGTGNGESWDTADGDLKSAMEGAYAGDQIWVAAGDYTPNSAFFTLKNGVSVYGGFPASGNPDMIDRDWNTNKTVLHGLHDFVVLCTAAVNARLDGFTITDGTFGAGGGMRSHSSIATVANCIFMGNHSSGYGGAMANMGSNISVINTLFFNNTSQFGGGAVFDEEYSNTEYKNVTFAFNHSSGKGGAILLDSNVDIMGSNCIFWGNTSTVGGKDMAMGESSSVTFDTSLIDESEVTGTFNGSGNNYGDPLFVNPATGDFRLLNGSPAIDSGSDGTLDTIAYPKDLTGNARIYGTHIDMGAYEHQHEQYCSIATTWNGSVWSNGVPNSYEYIATIDGNFSSVADLYACSLTVSSGTVTVNPAHSFFIKDALTVNGGSVTFENNSSLIQQGTVNANSGNILYKRNAYLRRQEYIYWASPVAGQNLHDFSPLTLNNRFYEYSESTNAFPVINPLVNAFMPAKGYMVRAPNTYADAPAAPQLWTGKFIGTPNNGNYIVPVTHNADGFNMLGNPYPSTISADRFLSANPGTLSFWAHINFSTTVSNYATYNLSGGTASAAGGEKPNGYIQAGQGFLFQTATAGNAVFNNTMRSANHTGQFFRMAGIQKDRFWLNLSTGQQPSAQMLVCYTSAATLGVDDSYDGQLIRGGNSISSLIDGTAYVIQARPSFTDTDEVPLSLYATTEGAYTISLDHFDGDFENQEIFLVDSQTNTIQNLKTEAYSFVSATGTFNNRFKIVYQNNLLGVADPVASANNVVVYKKDRDIMIDAGKMEISNVDVFDISGRLVYSSKDVNATAATIHNLQAEQQVLVVRIAGSNGEVVSKKIVF